MKNQKMILATTCIVLVIIFICTLIVPKVIEHSEIDDSYYDHEVYLVKNKEDYSNRQELSQIAVDEFDYKNFLSLHGIELDDDDFEEIEEKDFKHYNYALVFVPINSCGEEVDFDKAVVDKETHEIELKFNLEQTCGVCAPEYLLYEITLPNSIDTSYYLNIDWDIEETYCDPVVAYKPVLYLYPETQTNIKVNFANEDKLTTTYPKYNKEWNVTAHPNGDLYDNKNNYYYALYWEEKDYSKIDFNEGFYVSKDNAIYFLEEKLSTLGLNLKERNEFIMYWLPILENNKHNLVYFELTNELQKENKLIITPKPNTLIRIRMHVKKVNKETNIKEQQLTKQERKGYTAVEWGGVIHN